MPDRRTNRFEGRVAIVTGSSSAPGIGWSCAELLASEGASVVVNGRDPERLDAAVNRLQEAGHSAHGVCGSVLDEETRAALVDAATDRFGGLDVLVNAVGGTEPVDIDALTWEHYAATVEMNSWAAFALARDALRAGFADGGAIVNISSQSPRKTSPTMAAYAASKSALETLTRTLARDVGARNIRVNAVAPGLIRTEATRDLWQRDGGTAIGAQNVLPRIGQPEDIARATAFLCSDDAAWTTGVVLYVDGGNHLISGWSPYTPS
jgi:3-oxoacyl-[acyl-carrier protein] reductase